MPSPTTPFRPHGHVHQRPAAMAARPAGERKWEMLMLLNEKGVLLDYAAIDAEKDLQTLKEVLDRWSPSPTPRH